MGFFPTFYLLLKSVNPCETALGACGSISCACGNFYPKGYTWMCVTLVVACLLTVREASALDGRTKAATVFGALSPGGLVAPALRTRPERW